MLKARTVEPEEQPLLGNSCVTHNNGITVESSVFCVVCVKANITKTSCHYGRVLRWQSEKYDVGVR
jgi:hypothetical protein